VLLIYAKRIYIYLGVLFCFKKRARTNEQKMSEGDRGAFGNDKEEESKVDTGRGVKRSMEQMQSAAEQIGHGEYSMQQQQRKVFVQQSMMGNQAAYTKPHMTGAIPSTAGPQRNFSQAVPPNMSVNAHPTSTQHGFPSLLCREIYKDPDRAAVQLFSEFHRSMLGKAKLLRFFGNLLHLQSASFMYSSSASLGGGSGNMPSGLSQVANRMPSQRSHFTQQMAGLQQQQRVQRAQSSLQQQQQPPQQRPTQVQARPEYPKTYIQGKQVIVRLKQDEPCYAVKHFPFVGSAHKGIVYWLGEQNQPGEWSNPSLRSKDGSEPSMIITRSSSAKGSASDAAALQFTNSCTRRNPVIDEKGNHTNWYLFDFKNYRILPTHYSLRHGWKQGKFCLRSWKLEGSVTGAADSWVTFCQHTDDESLNSSPTNKNTWAFANRPNQTLPWVRYFKVSMTSPNSHGSYTMCLAGFEVYGACIDLNKPLDDRDVVDEGTTTTTTSTTAPTNSTVVRAEVDEQTG
jgi:hypothetical protein